MSTRRGPNIEPRELRFITPQFQYITIGIRRFNSYSLLLPLRQPLLLLYYEFHKNVVSVVICHDSHNQMLLQSHKIYHRHALYHYGHARFHLWLSTTLYQVTRHFLIWNCSSVKILLQFNISATLLFTTFSHILYGNEIGLWL